MRQSREVLVLISTLMVTLLSCEGDFEPEPYDLDFVIPRSEAFPEKLSAYGLFQGPLAALEPAEGVYRYELASELFTDYATKQRLVMIPEGSVARRAGERLVYPEGTILVKTFYYPEDLRAPAGARQIIETRLLVKRADEWNVATYAWDAEQREATLLLEGRTRPISWVDEAGETQRTNYQIPHEGECVTCHQLDERSVYIGPTLARLNRAVERAGETRDQLEYLAATGRFELEAPPSSDPIPDAKDERAPLEARARAYLDINCAHCHQPSGWDEAAEPGLDLRYQRSLSQSNLRGELRALRRVLDSGEMPYLGATMIDQAGISLVLQYLSSL